jgi:hypothetical protein
VGLWGLPIGFYVIFRLCTTVDGGSYRQYEEVLLVCRVMH